MSMPHEKTRAIVKTYEFLKELRKRTDIPADVKESAIWLLRHYPEPTLSEIKISKGQMLEHLRNPLGEQNEL